MGEEMPSCVKILLNASGYDTLTSLQNVKDANLLKLEDYINQNCSDVVRNLDCCYSDFYKSQATFKFLPGHATLLEALSKHVIRFYDQKCCSTNVQLTDKYTLILNELIKTAEKNVLRDVHHADYSNTIRYFATYIFLMCGRSCYEMLRVNLGFPSVRTICKRVINFIFSFIISIYKVMNFSKVHQRDKNTHH